MSGGTIGAGFTDFKHIKGYAITGAPAPGATSVTLLTSSLASRFAPDDDVLIGDGPGVNEFFGEYVRVTSVSGSTITFTPPLQQSYANNLGCIVPGWLNPLSGRRQHMTDIVFRDLSIAPPKSGPHAGVFGVVRGGVRIRFENVGFISSPFDTSVGNLKEISFATCGDVTIRDGFYDGKLFLGPVQNATVDNVVAGSLSITEFSNGCNISNVTTLAPPGIEVTGGPSARVNLTNCAVRGVTTVALIDATNVRIENLFAAQLTLPNGSKGVLATPLAPDPAGVVDGTNAGDWLMPLQRYVKNRKVASDVASQITLELLARSGQNVDLQQWQNSSGNVLFAVRVDGHLATANATEDHLGDQTHRLALYHAVSGDLIGYVPIHAAP